MAGTANSEAMDTKTVTNKDKLSKEAKLLTYNKTDRQVAKEDWKKYKITQEECYIRMRNIR